MFIETKRNVKQSIFWNIYRSIIFEFQQPTSIAVSRANSDRKSSRYSIKPVRSGVGRASIYRQPTSVQTAHTHAAVLHVVAHDQYEVLPSQPLDPPRTIPFVNTSLINW
jgi:hypothetical protein